MTEQTTARLSSLFPIFSPKFTEPERGVFVHNYDANDDAPIFANVEAVKCWEEIVTGDSDFTDLEKIKGGFLMYRHDTTECEGCAQKAPTLLMFQEEGLKFCSVDCVQALADRI